MYQYVSYNSLYKYCIKTAKLPELTFYMLLKCSREKKAGVFGFFAKNVSSVLKPRSNGLKQEYWLREIKGRDTPRKGEIFGVTTLLRDRKGEMKRPTKSVLCFGACVGPVCLLQSASLW